MNLKGKSFLTLLDYSKEEIEYLLNLSSRLKTMKRQGKPHRYLEGKNVVLLFQKDSTRTRCAFESGANDLGMGVTYLGPSGSQMGKKESVKDTARVLGRMYEGIQFRGYKHSDVEALAEHSGVPVWNGLTDLYHPTQVLADFLTVQEELGKLQGVKFAYVGDARNNMGNSLMVGSAKLGLHFTAVAPKDVWPDEALVEKCMKLAEASGGSITLTEDKWGGTREADVVYTDVWVSMGEPEDVWRSRIAALNDYQVDEALMKNAGDQAIFMHCLPAFHGIDTEIGAQIAETFKNEYPRVQNGEMEVTDAVIESPQSKVFEEAENRMHTIKAVMLATMSDDYEIQ